jgi:polar amino acid transport system permease protein
VTSSTSITERAAGASRGPDDDATLRVVHSRHVGRWVTAAVAAVLLAQFVVSVATNHAFRWSTFADYFFSDPIMHGLRLTLELTLVAMAIGVVLGVVLAMMRMSANPIFSTFSWVYAWLFRGTPTLVQLLLFYNFAALYPRLNVSIPFGPTLASADTNAAITPFAAAILGLGLNEAAYMSEIVRGGILSVHKGQTEAAMGIGMTKLKTFRRVVLPQALRVIIPPTSNNIIGMLKMTALVSVLSLADLLYATEQIYAINFQPIPLLIVATVWYLICTSILMIAQRFLERRLSRGYGGHDTRRRIRGLRLSREN